MPIICGSLSGPAASSSSTAAEPTRVLIQRSKALGAPPRWTCPRIVDAHVLVQPVGQHLAHVLGGDGIAELVPRTLRDDHREVAAACGPTGLQQIAHLGFPVVHARRMFREEGIVCAAGQRAHQGQVAAVAAHHLDDEAALMADRGAADLIERGRDAVQRGVRADGHVGAVEIVVDGANQPDDAQVRVAFREFGRHCAGLDQLSQQRRPFLPEQVGAGQAAIAPDDHQAVDGAFQQVFGRDQPAFAGAKCGAARGADHRAAALHDAAHVVPGHVADAIAAVDHSLVTLVDGVDRDPAVERRAHYRAQRRVHARRIAAACENPNGGYRVWHFLFSLERFTSVWLARRPALRKMPGACASQLTEL